MLIKDPIFTGWLCCHYHTHCIFLTTWFLLNRSFTESCGRQHSLNTPLNTVLATEEDKKQCWSDDDRQKPGSNHTAIHTFRSLMRIRGGCTLDDLLPHYLSALSPPTSSRWYHMFTKQKASNGLCRLWLMWLPLSYLSQLLQQLLLTIDRLTYLSWFWQFDHRLLLLLLSLLKQRGPVNYEKCIW